MLARRVIACLDVRDGGVVKGVNFNGLRPAGSAADLAARYDAEGIDEVIVLDQIEEMSKLIPNAELAVFTDASHFALWQDPQDFNKALLDFLAK